MIKDSSRRMLLIAGIILVAVILGMILIRETAVETNVTAKTTRVGLILNGPKDDASFCQTHYDSLMRIKKELNLEILCQENVPEDEACASAIDELISEGCCFIIGASFGYGDYLSAAADAHPDICFLHPTGTEKKTNLSSVFGRMYQARYLSGIVAGMRTKTGKLGYVAAFPFPEVIRGLNAFTLGVRSVRPDAEVTVRYCESWVDDEAAEKAGKKLFEKNPDIDVITMHTNSMKPNELAEEKGIWAVGYNMDNAERFPNSFLAACEWKWDKYYEKSILSFLQGKFHGEIEWIDMDEGIVGLSKLTQNAVPGSEEAVEEAEIRFESRTFDVFYGPITDNEGKLRVAKGESMSDDVLLNHFDWYVEGVTVEE